MQKLVLAVQFPNSETNNRYEHDEFSIIHNLFAKHVQLLTEQHGDLRASLISYFKTSDFTISNSGNFIPLKPLFYSVFIFFRQHLFSIVTMCERISARFWH